MKLFSRNPRPDQVAAQRDRLASLEGEAAALRGEVVELRELVSHLDQDTQMLLSAVEMLEPGKSVIELAQIMHTLVFRPFDLASFFVALVDWEKDLLEFTYYHEGGRPRQHPSLRKARAHRPGHPLRRPALHADPGGSRGIWYHPH